MRKWVSYWAERAWSGAFDFGLAVLVMWALQIPATWQASVFLLVLAFVALVVWCIADITGPAKPSAASETDRDAA
jgi:hypothetical protein